MMETAVALAAANDNNLLWDFASLLILIPVGIAILLIMCIAITLYVMSIVLVFSIILAVVNVVVSLVTGIGIHEMEGLYVIIDVIVCSHGTPSLLSYFIGRYHARGNE